MHMRRRAFLSGLAGAPGATFLPPRAEAHTETQAQTEAPPPYPRPDLTQRALPRRFTYATPVIDAHPHYYANEFVDLVTGEGPCIAM